MARRQEIDWHCPVCGRKVNWLSKEGSSTVITLQHDRGGRMRLLCLSCNSRHASFDGDSFYEADDSRRVCPDCKRSLPLEEFSKDNSGRWYNINTYCRECRNKRLAAWVEKNREKYNEKRREYYHRRIREGNPIPR